MVFRPLTVCLAMLAAPAGAEVFTFETPSGNIDCSVGIEQGTSDIQCIIHDRSGDPALPRPADCKAAWGHHFSTLSSGRVTMACGGPGQNLKMFEVAGYGVTSADWNGISCSSTRQGLDCRNADGHGFFLSRQVQRVY
ncbi:DUF6636 domain-containing protein [Paracoccus marinaquae]|uniref:Uncharacterized protein n=1 Tax=Paracoccus marinaquae TaxID=2841926 RepID=A0ABS6AQY2_9RHOB|nr:DUF6636 domain-containing protein [Paracoccus marinaquae]MBU3031896.1 hypothetical protein [Paracoccus marinaquae]